MSDPGDAPLDARRDRRVMNLLGLGVRARSVVVGVEQVRVAAKSGTLQLAFVGCDAAAHSRAKVDALLAARGVRVVRQYDVASLGAITGREAVAALGVTDAALARGMVEVLEGVEGQQHGSGGASRGRREAGSTGRAG